MINLRSATGIPTPKLVLQSEALRDLDVKMTQPSICLPDFPRVRTQFSRLILRSTESIRPPKDVRKHRRIAEEIFRPLCPFCDLSHAYIIVICWQSTIGAGGGTRTRTSLSGQGILSPLRLPFRHAGLIHYQTTYPLTDRNPLRLCFRLCDSYAMQRNDARESEESHPTRFLAVLRQPQAQNPWTLAAW